MQRGLPDALSDSEPDPDYSPRPREKPALVDSADGDRGQPRRDRQRTPPEPLEHRSRDRRPLSGPGKLKAPASSRVNAEPPNAPRAAASSPRQSPERDVEGDGRRGQRGRREARRRTPTAARGSASPARNCTPDRYWESREPLSSSGEEEAHQPRREAQPACRDSPQRRAPVSRPPSEYRRGRDREDPAAPKPATREFSMSDLSRIPFPPYDPSMIDFVYLRLFERTCREWGVPTRLYMMILRSLVSGKLANLMADLPLRYAFDYNHLKEFVAKMFGLQGENYRRAFRKVDRKAALAGNLRSVASEMAQNFNYWLLAENVTTFEGLRQLILKEQFSRLLPKKVAILVADKNPETVEEAAQYAENFKMNRARELGLFSC